MAELRGVRYSYLGDSKEQHWVARDIDLPSQWIRRQTAAAHGLDNWDWAAYAGGTELNDTLSRIDGLDLH